MLPLALEIWLEYSILGIANIKLGRNSMNKIFVYLSLIFFSSQATAEWIKVRAASVPEYRLLNGEIEAVNKSTVSSQTSGRVSKFNYDVDDFVAKGSIIAEFTNVEQKAKLTEVKSNAKAAKIAYEQSEIDFKRTKDVYQKKLVAKSALDKALSHRDSSKAKWQAQTASVVNAEKQLEYTIIRAPYDGIVTNRYVEIGESVRPGKPIMEGISLAKLRVITYVPETIVDQIRSKLSASILLQERDIAAKKVTIFPYADKATHSFKTRIEFDSQGVTVFPGMTVKVAFKLGEYSAILIPRTALTQRSELSLVYVRHGEQQILRHVKIGKIQGGDIEIIAGLDVGDEVLVRATDKDKN